ncbi:MAG TPA: hypothetical protein VLA13_05695 [Massilibacterium sp.]|nr:hypothetical protein [Massilibacterium sp.]
MSKHIDYLFKDAIDKMLDCRDGNGKIYFVDALRVLGVYTGGIDKIMRAKIYERVEEAMVHLDCQVDIDEQPLNESDAFLCLKEIMDDK